MKKILILLTCCALVTNTSLAPGDPAKCHAIGGAVVQGKCQITQKSCTNQNGIWYPTAQTCSLNECADRGQECWYGVCVDIKEGLKPENLEKGVDLASKTVEEKDIINKNYCCKLKFGNWHDDTKSCTF